MIARSVRDKRSPKLCTSGVVLTSRGLPLQPPYTRVMMSGDVPTLRFFTFISRATNLRHGRSNFFPCEAADGASAVDHLHDLLAEAQALADRTRAPRNPKPQRRSSARGRLYRQTKTPEKRALLCVYLTKIPKNTRTYKNCKGNCVQHHANTKQTRPQNYNCLDPARNGFTCGSRLRALSEAFSQNKTSRNLPSKKAKRTAFDSRTPNSTSGPRGNQM